MSRAKKLDVFGSGLVLLSAFFELFVLRSFADFQLDGHLYVIVENQYFISSMLGDLGLAVNGVDIDPQRFSDNQNSIQIYSRIYKWAGELFYSKLVVGALFALGTAMIIAGKILER